MSEGYRQPYKICRCGHAMGHHAGFGGPCCHYTGCTCNAFTPRSAEEQAEDDEEGMDL